MKNFRTVSTLVVLMLFVSSISFSKEIMESWMITNQTTDNQPGKTFSANTFSTMCIIEMYDNGLLTVRTHDLKWEGNKVASQTVTINLDGSIVEKLSTTHREDYGFVKNFGAGYDIFKVHFTNLAQSLPSNVKEKLRKKWEIN